VINVAKNNDKKKSKPQANSANNPSQNNANQVKKDDYTSGR